jgi:ribosome-binding factor A
VRDDSDEMENVECKAVVFDSDVRTVILHSAFYILHFSLSHRAAQIAGVIRSFVARVALSIPPAVSGLVSVADVRVSADLSYADIFVSAVDRSDAAVEFLASRKGRMRRDLAEALKTHRVPALRFHVDVEGQKASRIDRLLESL